MSDEHEPFIKTPKQLIAVVVLSFVIPIALIVMLVSYVASSKRDGAGSGGLTTEAIAQRIAPVAGLELVDASAPAELATGEAVYDAQCAACHTAGVAGAPKFGDSAAWQARLSLGYDGLLQSALVGKGAMAAQGGGKYSELEIGRAVVHMANAAGADFAEPVEPAAAAADSTEPAEKTATAATPATATAATAAVATPAPAAPPAPAANEPAQAAGPDLAVGEKIYNSGCMACHAAAIAGAPKFGDAAAWEGRAEKGVEALTATVISGKGAMPPRGASSASDAELASAVAYMLNSLQ